MGPDTGQHGIRAPAGVVTVLIADDDPDTRTMLERIFELAEGIHVVGLAADAVDAVSLARLHRPDVAFVDVDMPGGGGTRAARSIRLHSPNSQVVALSVHDEREHVLNMLAAGAVGYILKGASNDAIVRAARMLARGERITGDLVASLPPEVRALVEEETARARTHDERLVRLSGYLGGDGMDAMLQPVFDLDARAIVGFSATPWLGEGRDTDDVYADADDLGLSVELDMAFLEHVLNLEPGIDPQLRLAPEVSPATITAKPFQRVVSERASSLMVTVAEAAPVDHVEMFIALSPFRSAGGWLAVTDVDAGFDSLRNVQRVRPDVVTIDRALIRGVGTDAVRRASVTAIVSLARELGAGVIATGVETGDDLDTVLALGVTMGQGRYLSPPMPSHRWTPLRVVSAPRWMGAPLEPGGATS